MRKIDAISKIDSKLLKHLIFNSDGLVYAQDKPTHHENTN